MTARTRVGVAVAGTVALSILALVLPGAQAGSAAEPVPPAGLDGQQGVTLQAGRLQQRLGAKAVGVYLDGGRVVAAVSDPADAAAVRQAGATARVVRYSAAELGSAKSQLDTLARAGHAGQARSWYVDPLSGTVVVKVDRSRRSSSTFDSWLRANTGKVTVRQAAGRLTKAADLLGGYQVNMSNGFVCSLGFNARSAFGTRIFFTAGHCTDGSPTFSRNGVSIGKTRVSRFPGDDWGSVDITTSSWTTPGRVERWSGTDVAVKGWSNAPVGSALCKSGRTTRWTCGTIVARNVTVDYGGGDVVHGLFEHTACVESGDSGGANMTGNLAQGVTSGAATIGGLCLQKFGQRNESVSQPIGEALSASGASLVLG